MKRRKRQWLDLTELILSLLLIISAMILLFNWKREPLLFCLVFGLASVLFLVLGTDSAGGKKNRSRLGSAAVYFICAAAMISFFTVSILVAARG